MEIMSKVNFHQTFPPTLEYLSRLLEITDMTDELSKEEVSEITGIPTGKSSGKVEPHIDYAIYMGMIENISNQKGKYRLIRTKLGSKIMKEDMGLREEVTQLLCHVRLTSPATGAFLWRLLIRSILPNYPNGIRFLLLEDELKKQPVFATKKTVNMGPFYTTYEESFETFNFLAKTKDTLKIIPQTFKNELLYVYAYALLYEWEQIFAQNNEITADQVAILKFAAAFGFGSTLEYSIFERMSEKGIIRINGQLSPFTIIKNASSDAMIEKAYSLLC